MKAPKLNKPEGLAALITAAIYAAKNPEAIPDPGEWNWYEILRDFQEYNSVKFAEWLGKNHYEKVIDNKILYYRMDKDLKSATELFQEWLKLPPEEPQQPVKCNVEGCKRSADKDTGFCFEHTVD